VLVDFSLSTFCQPLFARTSPRSADRKRSARSIKSPTSESDHEDTNFDRDV